MTQFFNDKDLKTIFHNLNKVEAELRDKILRRGLKVAAAHIAEGAQQKAPKALTNGGNLKLSIKNFSSPSREGLNVVAAGVTVKYRGKGGAFYWLMVENGHATKRYGKITGRVPAQPYLRPALTERKNGARKLAIDKIQNDFKKIVLKKPSVEVRL